MNTHTKASTPQRVELFWIDCNDHMPDDEITVLVCTNEDDVLMAWHEDGLWRDYSDFGSTLYNVTHWMDLPETPKPTA